MTELLTELIKEYGYIILFLWGILEGEMGLIMGGLLSHTGDMWLPIAIFAAGLGGFTGDQIYFYIGRYSKKRVRKLLSMQRRKFAIANLLLKKHGWPIIFVQRYMYGLRTIIPIAIGITRYSAKKFALINLISAWAWAAITIVPVYFMGEYILEILEWGKNHWYFGIPILGSICGGFLYTFHRIERNILYNRRERVIKKALHEDGRYKLFGGKDGKKRRFFRIFGHKENVEHQNVHQEGDELVAFVEEDDNKKSLNKGEKNENNSNKQKAK